MAGAKPMAYSKLVGALLWRRFHQSAEDRIKLLLINFHKADVSMGDE